MTPTPLDRFLGTDENDPGCDGAFEVMDQYCDAAHHGEDAARRFPDFATHIRNCAACREDTEALLAALREMEGSDPAR